MWKLAEENDEFNIYSMDISSESLPLIQFGNRFPFLIPLIVCVMSTIMLSLPQIEELPAFRILHRTQ